MDSLSFLAFVGISLGLIVVPGPNVLVVVSTSISDGRLRSSQTIAGIGFAMAIQLLVAGVGASWLVDALVGGFELLKWFGICYLILLAVQQFRRTQGAASDGAEPMAASAVGSFAKGFFVALTNVKTILFFGAFLPQFVVPASSFVDQIALLSVTFWMLALMVNITYMWLASAIAERLSLARSSRVLSLATGSLYLAAAAALSVVKR